MNRIGGFLATVLTVLVLAGCASAQTGLANVDGARTGLGGLDGQVGDLRLFSVAIASPGARGSFHIAGDSAALLLTIANDGAAEDSLTGATTEAAEQIVSRDGDADPDPRLQVVVPPGGVAVLREVTGPHLELSRLRESLPSGSSVPVTFDFRHAGPVTLSVPIRTYTDVRPDKYLEPADAITR